MEIWSSDKPVFLWNAKFSKFENCYILKQKDEKLVAQSARAVEYTNCFSAEG